MKKIIIPALVSFSAAMLLTGCIGLSIGGGSTTGKPATATLGQQLIDLQKAKESGAITDAEFQAQKAKVLDEK